MSGTLGQFFEIPLYPSPQRFGVALNGVRYRLTLTYRDADMGGWFVDIADASDNPIACGIPLVTGHDMLEQFEYLSMNGAMWVYTDGIPAAVPTFENLGDQSHLMWISKPL